MDGAVADIADALVATLSDTVCEPDLEGLLWGAVHLFHRAAERLAQLLDTNEQEQRESQRAQDGADSDDPGRLFRFEAGHHSEMIPAGGLNVGWVDDTGLGSGSSGTLGCCFSQGVTRELDPVGVVYEAVEDRVSIGRVVDEFMPTSHRQLTGHQRRGHCRPAVSGPSHRG